MYIDGLSIVDADLDKFEILKADGNVVLTPIYEKNTVTFNPIDFDGFTGDKSKINVTVSLVKDGTTFESINANTLNSIVKDFSLNNNELYFKIDNSGVQTQFAWDVSLEGTGLYDKDSYEQTSDKNGLIKWSFSYMVKMIFTVHVTDVSNINSLSKEADNALKIEGFSSQKNSLLSKVKVNNIFQIFDEK